MEDLSPQHIGRDELNLAEMPIALIAERVPKGLKTLVYEGTHGKLTITGADAFGLPTSGDTDVILGLIELTRTDNGFTRPKVPFTRYELLKLLGRPDKTQYYKRLDESLNRWMGTTLIYEKAWYDASIKRRIDAKFHILESVIIYDQETRRALRQERRDLIFSSFTWNQIVFQSFQAENIKRLDLSLYFNLRSAISKQVYRFLDKRFYVASEWSFELQEFACGHVGLSSCPPSKLRVKLMPALEELQSIGFLGHVEFLNPARGRWRIKLFKNKR